MPIHRSALLFLAVVVAGCVAREPPAADVVGEYAVERGTFRPCDSETSYDMVTGSHGASQLNHGRRALHAGDDEIIVIEANGNPGTLYPWEDGFRHFFVGYIIRLQRGTCAAPIGEPIAAP